MIYIYKLICLIEPRANSEYVSVCIVSSKT